MSEGTLDRVPRPLLTLADWLLGAFIILVAGLLTKVILGV